MTDELAMPRVGVWHLMPKPVAWRHEEQTFIGWFDGSGRNGISAYNHETGRLSHHVFREFGWVDDHSAPGILERDDGRILAMWSPRQGENPDSLEWAISDNPYDISSWSDIKIYDETDGEGDYVIDDYPQLIYWDGNIRVFFRYRDTNGDIWKYIESTDNGETFGQPQEWVDFSGYRDQFEDDDRPETHRIYPTIAKEERDGNDRLHVVFGGYRQVNQGVRHFYLEDGAYYDSHGNAIGVSDGQAITDMDPLTLIWDGTDDHWTDSPKLNDVKVKDGDVFASFEDIEEVADTGGGGKYHARWAKYDSGAGSWSVSPRIVDMGGMIPESAPTPGGYHKGSIKMDYHDPSIVRISVEQEDRNYQIQEWTTDDDGATWTKVRDLSPAGPVEGSDHGKRGSPISPENNDGEELRVIYWAGRHDRFTDYDTSIMTEDTVAPHRLLTLGDEVVTNEGEILTTRW